MKKKTTYEKNPFGNIKLGKRVNLPNLPSPAEIAAAERTTKITLSLSSSSLAYFKQQAKEHNVPYQTMIRRLLDEYALRQH